MLKRFGKISTKLFVLLTFILLLFLTLLMLVQTLFFESYYEYKKKSGLIDGLNQLRSFYIQTSSEPESDRTEVIALFPKFEQTYSATIALSQPGSFIRAKDESTINIYLFDSFEESEDVQSFSDPANLTYLNLKNAFELWQSDPDLIHRTNVRGETILLPSDTHLSAITSLPGTDAALIATTSLQPVGEAAVIVRDFYLYFMAFALILIILLTYVLTRMISRPLVRLNDVAERMSKLDFSIQSETRSNDEIGSLGRTLNFLAQNLSDTLGQLRDANQKLLADIENEKRLERLRREFVASVSHELKTPISLIAGYAEGLQDGIVRGKRREEYVHVIIEESGRMAKLVEDMLNLSQLESGQFHLQRRPFPISELIESVTNKLRVTLQKKHLYCEFEGKDNCIIVLGDPFRIEQVLTNLLTNAIKHTAEGGSIRFSILHVLSSECEGASHIQVTLFNEGMPIPAADLDHIWDTFYTVDKSHNRELGGSGIGLAIVRNILTLHGSSFGVRNVDQGVVFYFTLPLAAY